MQIRLKTVTNENDIALAAQLAREIWHEHYDALLGSAQVDYMLSHFQSETAIKEQIGKGTVYLLAYWDDEPAGYCAYRPEEERMFLSKIYVKNDLRGRGIGKAFFDYVEGQSNGKKSVYLTVNKHNTHAYEVYQHYGYENVESVKADIGSGYYMDDYVMVKRV